MRSGADALQARFRDMVVSEAPRSKPHVRDVAVTEAPRAKPPGDDDRLRGMTVEEAPRDKECLRTRPVLMAGDVNLYDIHHAARKVQSTGRAGAYVTLVQNDQFVGTVDEATARWFSPTLLSDGGTFELPKYSADQVPFPVVVHGHMRLVKQWMRRLADDVDPANIDAIFNSFPLPRSALPIGELEMQWVERLALTDCKVLLLLAISLRIQGMPFMMMRVLGEKNARMLRAPGGVERVRNAYGIDAEAPEHALSKEELRVIERDWGWA